MVNKEPDRRIRSWMDANPLKISLVNFIISRASPGYSSSK
jgi:hypothetical protein